MFICLKRFLRKVVKQRNLYTYLHRTVLEISAEDLKAQFKWGRVQAQVRYREDALASDVQLSQSLRVLLLRRLLRWSDHSSNLIVHPAIDTEFWVLRNLY